MDKRSAVAHAASVDRQTVAVAERQREVVRRKLLAVQESRLRTHRRDLVSRIDQLRSGKGKPGGRRDTCVEAVQHVQELLQTFEQQKQTTTEMHSPAHSFISEFGRAQRSGGEVTIALAIAATKLIEVFLKLYGPRDDPANREERRRTA